MKHLLKLSDLSPEELHHILDVADRLKAEQKAGGTAPMGRPPPRPLASVTTSGLRL